MAKEMLISTVEGRECRIATVINGRLEDLCVERVSNASRVGNIYKGRITNVEAAIQAAFVDFGAGKNGFLHISDVHPQYFPKGRRETESVGHKRGHRDRPPIQECLRRGQEVVVQMTKEGIGTKGPTMTTYLSIPGRLLVMMPGMSKLGVSRKIESEEAREKIKEALGDIALPPDIGIIVRTAGEDRSKRDLQRDLSYLLRLWKTTSQRIHTCKAPCELYQESDLITRTLRDVFNSDISRIICDSEQAALQVKDFLDVAMPRSKHAIEVYVGKGGLYHDYGLEAEIEKIYARRVELSVGGSLVIDQTEALVAIDVNSGRFREHSDAETTAFNMNLAAADEVARQLRLRDMGGVIIIDFIDMREEKNRRAVEKALREAMKPDRAKTKIGKISAFGILEMTRQRVRPSLQDNIHRVCSHCEGAGKVKSEESQALSVMRDLPRATSVPDVVQVEVTVTPPVAHYLGNYQRLQLCNLENQSGKTIIIKADPAMAGSRFRIACLNNRGSEVMWDRPQPAGKSPHSLTTVSVDQIISQGRGPLPLEGGLGPQGGLYEGEEESDEAILAEAVAAAADTMEVPGGENVAPLPGAAPGQMPPGAVQAGQAPSPSGQPAGLAPRPAQGRPGGPAQAGSQGPQEMPAPGQGRRRRGRRRRGRSGKGIQQPIGLQAAALLAASQQAGPQGQTLPPSQDQGQPQAQPQGQGPEQQHAPEQLRPQQQQAPQLDAEARAYAPAAPVVAETASTSPDAGPDAGAEEVPPPPKKKRTHRGGRKHRRKPPTGGGGEPGSGEPGAGEASANEPSSDEPAGDNPAVAGPSSPQAISQPDEPPAPPPEDQADF